MTARFAFKRYCARLRRPLRTSQGLWAEREGVIVRLEGEDGRVGWGEAAPVPAFQMESADELAAACAALPAVMTGEEEEPAITPYPTLENALVTAWLELAQLGEDAPAGLGLWRKTGSLPMAALLPAGRGVLAVAAERAEMGFRTFKWKVGAGDLRDELVLLDDVCAALPGGSRLRLDANGAWDRRGAERWLERCADRPVEFVEQPVAPDARGADDLLAGLAGDYPTPIALDESLIGEGDLERWLGAGWPGVYVLKPSLFASPTEAVARLAGAKARVVFSSAMETAVGARAALRHAFAYEAVRAAAKAGPPAALGFGVWPLFENAALDGPALAPFIRQPDVAALSPEKIWTELP